MQVEKLLRKKAEAFVQSLLEENEAQVSEKQQERAIAAVTHQLLSLVRLVLSRKVEQEIETLASLGRADEIESYLSIRAPQFERKVDLGLERALTRLQGKETERPARFSGRVGSVLGILVGRFLSRFVLPSRVLEKPRRL